MQSRATCRWDEYHGQSWERNWSRAGVEVASLSSPSASFVFARNKTRGRDNSFSTVQQPPMSFSCIKWSSMMLLLWTRGWGCESCNTQGVASCVNGLGWINKLARNFAMRIQQRISPYCYVVSYTTKLGGVDVGVYSSDNTSKGCT